MKNTRKESKNESSVQGNAKNIDLVSKGYRKDIKSNFAYSKRFSNTSTHDPKSSKSFLEYGIK